MEVSASAWEIQTRVFGTMRIESEGSDDREEREMDGSIFVFLVIVVIVLTTSLCSATSR